MDGVVHKKIAASTLIEVLIAMVIIMVVFTIAMRIFGNVLNSGVSYKKIQVQQQLNVLSKDVISKGYIAAEQVQADSVNYVLSALPTNLENVDMLEIKAVQDGKTIGTVKCLFNTVGDEKN